MKTLCTCAALAVATAFARGNFAGALNQDSPFSAIVRDEQAKITGITKADGDTHCTGKINEWRKTIDSKAVEYNAYTAGDPATELDSFLNLTKCTDIKSGAYNHIVDKSGTGKMFVISAAKSDEAARSNMTCDDALNEWKKGFEAFNGQYPSVYTEKTGAYANPNAVGLVSLLSDQAQAIYCGTANNCDGIFVCYFKPSHINASDRPVSPEMWHKVEESHKTKPKLTAHDSEHGKCLEAVNAVRKVAGLDLPEFTAPKALKSLRVGRGAGGTDYEKALYNLTCKEIEGATIDPTVAEEHTLIYATSKESQTPPTAEEAVKFWQSGYSMLGTELPPSFKKKGTSRESSTEAITGEIYYKNAVAGYVSLMADNAREMRCYDATGCTNAAALLCFLKEPTLVNDQPPISATTWKKILALNEGEEEQGGSGSAIKFQKRSDKESCLTEINEFRTQEGLGLKAFVAETSTSTGDSTEGSITAKAAQVLAKEFTCDGLKAGNAPILYSDSKLSVMYYSGESATCSDAVDSWKKGYEKFSDVTIPPKYTSTEELYKTGAATNFISLVSEGADTKVTCYTVTGCTEAGLVCVLKPAVFTEEQSPITEATWAKVTKTLSNGATVASVYGTLLSSVLVAVGLFALNF